MSRPDQVRAHTALIPPHRHPLSLEGHLTSWSWDEEDVDWECSHRREGDEAGDRGAAPSDWSSQEESAVVEGAAWGRYRQWESDGEPGAGSSDALISDGLMLVAAVVSAAGTVIALVVQH